MWDDGSAAFSRQALVITVGMLLPAVPVALAEDVPHNAHHPLVALPLIRAVEYDVFLLGLGLIFAIGSWLLIERSYLDRVSFLLASMFWPWVMYSGVSSSYYWSPDRTGRPTPCRSSTID